MNFDPSLSFVPVIPQQPFPELPEAGDYRERVWPAGSKFTHDTYILQGTLLEWVVTIAQQCVTIETSQ